MASGVRDFWEGDTVRLLLPVTATLFGMQTLRVLIPTIVHVLGDRFEVSTVNLGLFAFLPFLATFLAGALWRILRPRWALIVSAGGLGVARLAEQVSPDPVVDLALSALGAVFFMLFLPIYLGTIRSNGPSETGRLGLAVLAGLAVDSGIHGLLGTYDLSWQPGPTPILLVGVLFGILLVGLLRSTSKPSQVGGDLPGSQSWPLLAVGPFLFLEAVVFQNLAQVSALTGWILPGAFLSVAVVNLAGLAVGVFVVEGEWLRRGWAVLVMGGVLVAVLVVWPARGTAAAASLLAGHVAAALLLIGIFTSMGAAESRAGLSRTTLAAGLGAVLFVALSFAYYVVYQLSVPYENTIVPVVAAVIIALAGLGASFHVSRRRPAISLGRSTVWISAALLVLPFPSLAAWQSPEPGTGSGWPVRVMDYNLHVGFDTEGRLGLEALAEVIEASEPDVVALHEISRGMLVNGSADMLSWLSQRLSLPHVWNPASDLLLGNAILSRFPIRDHGSAPLPRGGVALRRGYVWARIDVGGNEEILFIATHLHNVEDEGHVRELQVTPILEFWGGADRTVVVGDFNGEPDAPEIALIRDAGLLDAFEVAGSGVGHTYKSSDLYQRIDYIWTSPDLVSSDFLMPRSTASDHLALIVTVDR
ncbi:MAG: endonuclease/exonuclease/phosphatase family protein [Anaerolineae bacterium]